MLIPVALTVYIIGCLGCSHYQYGIQIPVLSVLYQSANFTLIRRILMMGFPFFICGYSVRLISESVKQKESRIHFTRIICIAVFLWGIELYWVISNNLFSSIVISPMLYPLVTVTLLVLLTRTCTISSHASSKCRAAANFMYYAHPICLMHLSLTPLASCPTLCFLITIILTFLAGSFLKKRKGRIIPLLIG